MKLKLTEKHKYLKEDIAEIIKKYFGEIANDDNLKKLNVDLIHNISREYEFWHVMASSKYFNESDLDVTVHIQETEDSEYVELNFVLSQIGVDL